MKCKNKDGAVIEVSPHKLCDSYRDCSECNRCISEHIKTFHSEDYILMVPPETIVLGKTRPDFCDNTCWD